MIKKLIVIAGLCLGLTSCVPSVQAQSPITTTVPITITITAPPVTDTITTTLPVVTTTKYYPVTTTITPPPIILKDFASLEELQSIINPDILKDITVNISMGNDGVANLNAMCVPLAQSLKDYAEAQGYYLSLNILPPAEYQQWYGVSSNGASHMVCMAVIGEDIYYIEPSTTKIWLAGYNGSITK